MNDKFKIRRSEFSIKGTQFVEIVVKSKHTKNRDSGVLEASEVDNLSSLVARLKRNVSNADAKMNRRRR